MRPTFDPIKTHPTSNYDPAHMTVPAGGSETLLSTIETFMKDAFSPSGTSSIPPVEIRDFIEQSKAKHGFAEALRSQLTPKTIPKTRLLELACGNAPLLGSLLDDHGVDKCGIGSACSQFGRKITYYGADIGINVAWEVWGHGQRARFNKCFDTIEFFPCDLSKSKDLDFIASKGPFDVITLSNVLHELPPKKWPLVFAKLSEQLAENGRLILLDLNYTKRFELELWQKNLKTLTERFWEANAVWITRDDAKELLVNTGLKIFDDRNDRGRNGDWWYVIGERSPSLGAFDKRVAKLEKTTKNILVRQHREWHAKFPSAKKELASIISNPSSPGDNIITGLWYLCLCTSACVRDNHIVNLP